MPKRASVISLLALGGVLGCGVGEPTGRSATRTDSGPAVTDGPGTAPGVTVPPPASVTEPCPTDECAAVDLRIRSCSQALDCTAFEGCGDDGRCGPCVVPEHCRPTERCQVGLCVPPEPPSWWLTVTREDFATLYDDPYTEIFVPCALEVLGTRYEDGCRIRLRGGTSLDFPKKSFRINFAEGVPHPGPNRKINLRAEYNDPTFLRNFLSLQSFRRLSAVPVSAIQFVRLYLNGEYYGLMTEVEPIDETFLRGQGLSDEAPTYQADPPRELASQGAGGLMPLPDSSLYPQVYEKKVGDSDDYGDLIALIEEDVWNDRLSEEAGGPPAARLRASVDVGEYLDYLAVNGLLQSHDHVRKNYYLTRQPKASGPPLWMVIAWDLDLTFGCLWDDVEQSTLCDSTVVDGWYDRGTLVSCTPAGFPALYFYNQLIHQVLADEQLRAAFTGRLCRYLDGPVWQVELPAMVDVMAAYLRSAVGDDLADLNLRPEDYDREVAELKRFIVGRADFLRGELACP